MRAQNQFPLRVKRRGHVACIVGGVNGSRDPCLDRGFIWLLAGKLWLLGVGQSSRSVWQSGRQMDSVAAMAGRAEDGEAEAARP